MCIISAIYKNTDEYGFESLCTDLNNQAETIITTKDWNLLVSRISALGSLLSKKIADLESTKKTVRSHQKYPPRTSPRARASDRVPKER